MLSQNIQPTTLIHQPSLKHVLFQGTWKKKQTFHALKLLTSYFWDVFPAADWREKSYDTLYFSKIAPFAHLKLPRHEFFHQTLKAPVLKSPGLTILTKQLYWVHFGGHISESKPLNVSLRGTFAKQAHRSQF